MKTLGLIGGMSWESTTVYYQWLNRLARERLGGHHSASLLIRSLDFAPIAALQVMGDWDGATAIMIQAARTLEVGGAQALMICANTMHRMASDVQGAVGVPLIHVADATAAAVRKDGMTRPLLLATRYTMEQSFYRDRLRVGGVDSVVPAKAARERLHGIIYDELVQGRVEPQSRSAIVEIARRAAVDDAIDSVILGCTEFGLLVGADDLPVPVYDTTEIHARGGMAFALGDVSGVA